MATHRCVHPFSFDVDGVSRVVSAGDVVSSDDPRFAERRELFDDRTLFEPLEDFIQRRTGVEQATAAPGERRSVSPPKRSQAAKPSTKPAATGSGGAEQGGKAASTDKEGRP